MRSKINKVTDRLHSFILFPATVFMAVTMGIPCISAHGVTSSSVAAISEILSDPTDVRYDKIYSLDEVDEKPEFPGGEDALASFIKENLVYPAGAAENGIQGNVRVSFVVRLTGKIQDIKVLRVKDPELDKAAVNLVKSFPKFKPGKLSHMPVNVEYTITIPFRLTDGNK